MAETLSPEHPNLIQAVARLRRIFLAWGGLFLLMGFFTAAVLREAFPLAPLPWLVMGVIVLIGRQPAYLSMVAVLWGMSIVSLIPNVSTLIGPDPISSLLELSAIEGIALGVVRVLLLFMAWNQFMFYRMLYGTEHMSGLSPDLPAIPEMVPNKTVEIAKAAQLIGVFGLIAALGAAVVVSQGVVVNLITIAYSISILSIGLGLGVVFSPTTRRNIGLSSIGIGAIVFITIFLIGRLVLL